MHATTTHIRGSTAGHQPKVSQAQMRAKKMASATRETTTGATMIPFNNIDAGGATAAA